MAPVMRLAWALAVFFAIAAWPAFASAHWPLGMVAAVAVAITLMITVASYYAFGVNQVRSVLESRLRRRLVPSV
jgi:hypothetical protein